MSGHTEGIGPLSGPHKQQEHKSAALIKKGVEATPVAPSKSEPPPSSKQTVSAQHKTEPLNTISPAKKPLPSAVELLKTTVKGSALHHEHAFAMAREIDKYVATAYPKQVDHAVKHAIEHAQATHPKPLSTAESTAIALKAEAKILKRFEHAIKFFCTIDQRKDPPLPPLERMSLPFAKLARPQAKSVEQEKFDDGVAKYAANLVRLAFDQHYENPEQYVSHGFDHSINVANYTRSVLALNPQIAEATAEKYKISKGEAEFILETVALLHDCGYPCVGCRAKSVHGISGADLVLPLRPMFDQMITSPNANKELLFNDFRNSILFHSADKIEQGFSAKIITTMGTFLADHSNVVQIMSHFYDPAKNPAGKPKYVTDIFVQNKQMREEIEKNIKAAHEDLLKKVSGTPPDQPKITIHNGLFPGRFADLEHNKDRLLGLEFTMTDLLKDPLTMIRLVDNMDMSVTRFSPTQSQEAFRFIYNTLGDNKPISQFGQALEKLEKEVDDLMRSHSAKLKKATSAEKEAVEKHVAALVQAAFRDQIKPLAAQPSNDPLIKKVLAHLPETDIAKLKNVKDARHLLNKAIIDATFETEPYKQISAELKEDIRHIAMYLGSSDVRHFGGCEAVRDVRLVSQPKGTLVSGLQPPAPRVIVTVDKDVFDKLNAIRVTETSPSLDGTPQSVSVGVGEYQIWRANDAYRSILVGGANVVIHIEDTHGHDVDSTIEVQ